MKVDFSIYIVCGKDPFSASGGYASYAYGFLKVVVPVPKLRIV